METVHEFFLHDDWPIELAFMIFFTVIALLIVTFVGGLIVSAIWNYLNQRGSEILRGEAVVKDHVYCPPEACNNEIEPARRYLHLEFEGMEDTVMVTKKNYRCQDGDKVKIRYGVGRLTKKPFILGLAQ